MKNLETVVVIIKLLEAVEFLAKYFKGTDRDNHFRMLQLQDLFTKCLLLEVAVK